VPGNAPTTGSRTALVLAGSRGLGFASARALAAAGLQIALCGRSAESLATAAAELGPDVLTVTADVASTADLERVFSSVDKRFGRLDVLVANAGGPPPGRFDQVGDDAWQSAFELTLMSAVRSMRLAVERMRPRGFGRILVIGSSSVRQPIDGLVLSNAFRPALAGVVKTLAAEVARDGITVNLVAPGRFDTDRVRELDERRASDRGQSYEDFRAASEKSISAGRYGRPEEVGSLVAFLASDDAAYLTGQSLLVDGGMVAALP
jgi:3-oxoacyl-[acyl-carrier protein] reductase